MASPDTRGPDAARNRDEDLKPDRPGAPPRPATEPTGSEGSSRTHKTQTDPATGEPRSDPPAPA